MEDISIDIRLGEVSSLCGKLSFTLRVEKNMEGRIWLYASDPTDLRKSGVLITLDANGWQELNSIVNKVNETIHKMQDSHQMSHMAMKPY